MLRGDAGHNFLPVCRNLVPCKTPKNIWYNLVHVLVETPAPVKWHLESRSYIPGQPKWVNECAPLTIQIGMLRVAYPQPPVSIMSQMNLTAYV